MYSKPLELDKLFGLAMLVLGIGYVIKVINEIRSGTSSMRGKFSRTITITQKQENPSRYWLFIIMKIPMIILLLVGGTYMLLK